MKNLGVVFMGDSEDIVTSQCTECYECTQCDCVDCTDPDD